MHNKICTLKTVSNTRTGHKICLQFFYNRYFFKSPFPMFPVFYLPSSLQQLSHILLQFAESHTSSKWWAMSTRRHLRSREQGGLWIPGGLVTPALYSMKWQKGPRDSSDLRTSTKNYQRKNQRTDAATPIFPISSANPGVGSLAEAEEYNLQFRENEKW